MIITFMDMATYWLPDSIRDKVVLECLKKKKKKLEKTKLKVG